MQKPAIILLCMAVLLAAGLGVSIYSSQVIFDSLSVGINTIEAGVPLEISANIEQGRGVYAVEISDYTEGMTIKATVLGPLRSIITSSVIEEPIYEERFSVDETFEYTLVIETDSQPVSVVGVIGPEPGAAESSLGFVSLYMLLIGVIGMVVSTIYVIISKRRARSSSNSYPFR